jgi:single-strand DNA-binding protein
MATYELTGTVKLVMDTVKFDSGFSKREFVVTTIDDRYPQDIKLECVKDRAALLNNVKPGQRVTVSFDLRGNENKGRYYVSLSAWKVEAEQDASKPDASDDGPPPDQLAPAADQSDTETPF